MSATDVRHAPSGDDVPPALAARVAAALAAHGGEAGGASGAAPAASPVTSSVPSSVPSPEACLAASEALLVAVLHADERARTTALDLLAADALVTRAFELAAAEPTSLEATAQAAMRRMAAVVGRA